MIKKLKKRAKLAIPYLVKPFYDLVPESLCNIVLKQKWDEFDSIVTNHASKKDDFFFIQIGSNDGKCDDPIYEYVLRFNWSGILVEPNRNCFNELVKNYRDVKNLIFSNAAISSKDEIRNFYYLKKNKRLGSFFPHIVFKKWWMIPNIKENLIVEKIRCISLKTLMQIHNVSKIDLLCIDTEGYDYEIIKQINFVKVKPWIILYEHKHLIKNDKNECENLLRHNGYSLTKNNGNALAYLNHL